jgi:hypothetical protein
MVDKVESRLATEMRARGFSPHPVGESLWFRQSGNDTLLWIQPRSRKTPGGYWFEFGIGLRYEKVEAIVNEALGENDVISGTLGCDLRHLVDGGHFSGWDFSSKSEFLKVGFDRILEILDRVGFPILSRFAKFEALRALIDARVAGTREDPFIVREHHYVPVVYFLDGDYSAAQRYLQAKLEEQPVNAGDAPFWISYRKFAAYLTSMMAH